MCGPGGSCDPILTTYKVTRTDNGEIKYKVGLTPEGAIKLSLFPPSVCEVEVFRAINGATENDIEVVQCMQEWMADYVQMWVEPDETGD